MKIGVISDTHGKLRPEALAALAGSELVLHAGDVGKGDILDPLRSIAPVHVIRGNIDRDEWARDWPDTLEVDAGGLRFFLLHDVKDLKVDPVAAGYDVVVSGHSHRPSVRRDGGVLYFNPGAAGPRRFSLPITVARLEVHAGVADVEIIDLFA